jgi:hypothetical protein
MEVPSGNNNFIKTDFSIDLLKYLLIVNDFIRLNTLYIFKEKHKLKESAVMNMNFHTVQVVMYMKFPFENRSDCTLRSERRRYEYDDVQVMYIYIID